MKAIKNQARPPFETRLTMALLFIMAGVYPLWTTSDYQGILQSKFYFLAAVSGAYLAVLMIYGVTRLIQGHKPPSLKRLWLDSTIPQKFILLFWLCCAASSLFSEYGAQTLLGLGRLEGLISLTIYCLLFLCTSAFARPDRRIVYIFGVSMTLLCLISIRQLHGGNPFSLYPGGLTYLDRGVAYTGAYLGTIGNTDLLAALLCVAVPTFAVSLLRFQGKAKFALLLPLALCLYVLVKQHVSAGLVGVGAGMLLMLPIVVRAEARTRRAMGLAVLVVVLAGAAAVYLFGGRLGGTAYELSEVLRGRAQDSFGSGRAYIWRETLKLVPERLWLGGGPDTLIARSDIFFERYDEKLSTTIHAVVDAAHNEYLNLLVNQGLLALLSYLAAVGVSCVLWIRRAQKSTAAAISGGAVLCYGIQAFFGISCCITAPFFWLSLGLLDNASRRLHSEVP